MMRAPRTIVALLGGSALVLLAWVVAAALNGGQPMASDTTPPSAPPAPVASVAATDSVLVSWGVSADDVGVVAYDIYRSLGTTPVAILSADATLVASVGATTSVTVAARPDEALKAYTYYYVIVAKDEAGNASVFSANASPDPHGTQSASRGTNACQLCHSPHGAPLPMALGAKSAAACYRCHGQTSSTAEYGAGSTFDVQADFREDTAIATSGPQQPTGGSAHRNSYMAASGSECYACHTPHRKPYDANPASSFNRLLRTQLTTSPVKTYRLNTDASAVGNQFCGDCHGSSATPITIAGGSGAYSRAGGDHFASYKGPHAAVSPGDANPAINCLVCHNNHASAVGKLIDYRGSDTTSKGNLQAGLCFQCHSASGPEAGRPNAWNGRDVKAEFARPSHHPTSVGEGLWQPRTSVVFAQSKQAEFGLDTAFQTTANAADGDGSAVLATYTAVVDPPQGAYLFHADPNQVTMRSYATTSGVSGIWNSDFVPTPDTGQFQSIQGTVLFSAGGKVYRTRGAQSTVVPMMRQYTPPAGAGTGVWADPAVTSFSGGGFGVAAQAAVATPTSVAYISRGGASNTINWWQFSGATQGSMNFSAGNLGVGSGLAYSPVADRLWVVNRSGTAGDGNLYYLSAPGTKTGGQTFASTGVQITYGGGLGSYMGRLAQFKNAAGTDFLAYIGVTPAQVNDTVVIHGLSGTPSAVQLGGKPPFPSAIYDGCDLVWDGVPGGYLYALHGWGSTGVSRIRIPADPTLAGNWGSWTAFSDAPPADVGSAMTLCSADPPAFVGPVQQYAAGTVTSPEIDAPANATSWGTLSFSEAQPANTTLSVKVQGHNGTGWVDLLTADTSPADLSAFPPTTYAKIRLVGQLTTADTAVTPRLDAWSLTASYQYFQEGSYADQAYLSFAQSTQAELLMDTTFQALVDAADGNGSSSLATYTVFTDPAQEPYLFYSDAGAFSLSSYRPSVGAAGAWNSEFTPAADTGQFVSASGSTLFAAGGKVYRTRGGNSAISPQIREYTPPANSGTGTWSTPAIATFSGGAFWTGAQATVATASSVAYVSHGGGSGNISWWQYPGGTQNFMQFFAAGALGGGSGIAYSPVNDRLWVVNRNGPLSNGSLYYLSAPGTKTGAQTFTNTGVQVTANTGTLYWGRLAEFKNSAGTDFLAYIGTNSSLANDTVILSGLGGTPAKVDLGKPPFSGALGDGCDLVWDGVPGGYLYAVRGGGNAGVARIQIPANPSVAGNWGNWVAFASSPGIANPGSAIALAPADPAPYPGAPLYHLTGRITSVEILPHPSAHRWGSVAFSGVQPANTTLAVDVQGWDGSTWVGLTTATGSPTDLSAYTVAQYPKLRLMGQFTTTNQSVTPRLDDWTATSVYLDFRARGAATCVNCHNSHSVAAGGGSWDTTRVSDPSNTKNGVADFTSFCLGCHDGTPPSQVVSASAIVPYSVVFRDLRAEAPFFPGWDKQAFRLAYTSSGHFLAPAASGRALCQTCHDPHGSANPRLTAWTRPMGVAWTGTAPAAGVRDNTSSAGYEQNLCYMCHGDGVSPRGKASGAQDIYTPASSAYAHPMGADGRHSDVETSLAMAAGNRHAECTDCHDPHAARPGVHTTGTSEAGPVMYGAVGVRPLWTAGNWGAVTGYTPVRLDGGAGDFESYVCFKCHSSHVAASAAATVLSGIVSPSGGYTQTNIALEFNPDNYSGHNVAGRGTWPKTTFSNGYTWDAPDLRLAPGWTPDSDMTCSDCHQYDSAGPRGPHGSNSKFVVSGGGTKEWWRNTLSEWSSTMCARCHVTKTPNQAHNAGNHNSRACEVCHVRIPHGWKRPRLLRYGTDGMPYVDRVGAPGLLGVTLADYGWLGPGSGGCAGDCGSHGAPGPYW